MKSTLEKSYLATKMNEKIEWEYYFKFMLFSCCCCYLIKITKRILKRIKQIGLLTVHRETRLF